MLSRLGSTPGYIRSQSPADDAAESLRLIASVTRSERVRVSALYMHTHHTIFIYFVRNTMQVVYVTFYTFIPYRDS